jgi:hypothetical protein
MIAVSQSTEKRQRLLLLAVRQAAIIVANAIARYLELQDSHCDHCGNKAA